MKVPAIPGDPRRAIGAVVFELIKAGCAWQAGRLALARTCAKRAAIAIDIIRARLKSQHDRSPREGA